MKKIVQLIVSMIFLTAVPAWAASEIVAPLAVLSTSGTVIPPKTDIRIYSPPMVLYGVFHDGSTNNAYMLSSDPARKKLMTTDSAGNAQTYTDSDALAGTSYRGGVMYGGQVVIATDYYPGGGAYYSGLTTVNKDGTFSQWAGASDHGGSGFVIQGVKNSLFLPAVVPAGVAMAQGISARALRSNYTFGAVGNIFFKSDGSLFAFTSSPNRQMLAKIDSNGVSSKVIESDILVGKNFRAGAPFGNGYVVAIDYAPAAGNPLSGIHTLNSDGTHTEWTLSQGHSGISDLIPAPTGGYYFTDFENDNIWHITTPGQAETALLKDSPVALMSVAVNDGGNIAAVNWVPGEWWSNGGINAVYRITGNSAVRAAQAPAGSQFFAIAAGKGGIFGTAFYISDTTGGTIFRLESDNTLTPVITGLTNPGRLKFDPITGNLAVVCDEQYILWFGANLTPFQAQAEPAETPKGLFFSDFENDNVWFARDASTKAIPILDSNVPPGLGALTYNDLDNTIYALNWQGGWPFGGEDSIYAIQPNGTAKQIIKGSFASIAMSKGGAFGQALYMSDATAGKIVKLESNGTLAEVVSGLSSPGPLSFDPLTGTLVVICDGGKQIVWIGSNLMAPAAGDPGTVGTYFAPAEQEFVRSGHFSIDGYQVAMDISGTVPGYYHAVSKRTLSGDFEINASIAMSAKSLASGQNRSATVQVSSDVAGQRGQQIAYAGIYQKTVGYASTGGQYYAFTDMMINGGWGRFNYRALSAGQTSGTFKIRRSGGVITTHYLNGAEWVQLSVNGQGFPDRVRVDFQIDTSWDATSGVDHAAVFNETDASTVTTTTTSTTTTTTTVASTTTTTQAGTTTTSSTTTTTGSTTTTTLAGGGATLNVVGGWNLMGNSSSGALNVASVFGDGSKVTTVWKWIVSKTNWAFYTPMIADGGAAYAASQGYDFMSSVSGGEGFWVNAKTAFTASLPAGTAIGSASFQVMASGWNLIATGDNKTPSAFNKAIGLTPPAAGDIPLNLTTLWAWDAVLANWYFYAPSLEKSGGLSSYIQSKSYLDFGTKTLTPTTGFWVNKP